MASTDVFLSYHHSDNDSVQKVRQILEARGVSTFFDRENLAAGLPWPQALEQALRSVGAVAVFVGSELGLWQKREMGFALDRQVIEERAGRSFPVIPVLLPRGDLTPSFLFLNTCVDLRKDLTAPDVIDKLVKAIRGKSGPPPPDEMAALCPYQGLRAFREEHAAFFFGREVFSERLLEIIRSKSGLVAVIGASGSGKSSVVHAGLLPLLRRQRPPAETWDAVSFTPGNRPFHRLAASLIPLLEPAMTETDRMAETRKLGNSLAAGDVQIGDVAERIIAKSKGTDRLLLIADQFEELFTLAPEADRKPFVDSMLMALGRAPLEFVLTLRADYYGHVIGLSRELSDRLEQSIVNVGSMNRGELESALVKPAQKVGLDFEPGLTERLLHDLGQEPSQLPLLEFALTELWAKRRGRLMTHAAYQEFGGVTAAISHRAHAVLAKFSPQEQASIRRIFTRLVRVAPPDRGGEDTRQRASFKELGVAARPLVDALADARLLVSARDQDTGEETIEVSHEALIQGWSDLRTWLNEDREFLLWRQRLRLSLADWQLMNHDDGALLRGSLLTEAGRWRSLRAADLSEEEREFIGLSTALQDKERLERERSRRRQVMMLAGGLVIALILAGAAGLLWRQAVNASRIAQAESLLSQATLIDATEPSKFDRAALLAIESLNLGPSAGAESLLRKALTLLPKEISRFQIDCDDLDATFSSGGGFIACLDNKSGHMKVVSTLNGKELARVPITEFHDVISVLASSPDGRFGVAGFRQNGFRVFDTQTRGVVISAGKGETTAVTFDSVGKRLAAAVADGSGFEVTIHTLTIRNNSPQHYQIQQRIGGLTFSSDGRFLAALHEGRESTEVTILDLATGQRRTIAGGAATASFALSEGAKFVVLSFDDNTVRVINTESGTERSRLSQTAFARAVALSGDNKYAASGSENGTAHVIEVDTGRQVSLVPVGSAVRALAFTPGNNLVLLCDDGVVRIVDFLRKPSLQASQAASGTIIDISPSGRYFTTLSLSGSRNGSPAFELGINDRITGKRLWQGGQASLDVITRYTLDEKYVVAVSGAYGVRTYETNSGKEQVYRKELPDRVAVEAISGDGKTIAWATPKSVEILHADGTSQEPLELSNIRLLELGPDGSLIAAGSESPKVFFVVLDLSAKKEILGLQDEIPVRNAAFSANGRYLLTFNEKDGLRLYAVPSGKMLWRRTDLEIPFHPLFDHDSRRLALAGGKKPAVTLVDTATGSTLSSIQLSGIAQPVGVAFGMDGSYLDVADETSVTRHYLRPKELIEQACSLLIRNLPKDEWNTLMSGIPYHLTCRNLP